MSIKCQFSCLIYVIWDLIFGLVCYELVFTAYGQTFVGILWGYVVVSLLTIDSVIPGIVGVALIVGVAYYEKLAFHALKFYVEHISMVRRDIWEICPADFYTGKEGLIVYFSE